MTGQAEANFNTSHVTVYQLAHGGYNAACLFQYISCYCLSSLLQFIIPCNLFQYISCYCLSENFHTYKISSGFQYISCYCLSYTQAVRNAVDRNFNTSHVTVYPRPHTTVLRYTVISIHLMLLFITARHNIYEQPHIISIHLMLLFINLNRWENNVFDYFNTSHVTVYLDAGTSNSVPCVISIHLMLLFILEN